MDKIFLNDCAADGCYKKNVGEGKQMCKEHQDMYDKGIPFKAFYGKTVLKQEFIKNWINPNASNIRKGDFFKFSTKKGYVPVQCKTAMEVCEVTDINMTVRGVRGQFTKHFSHFERVSDLSSMPKICRASYFEDNRQKHRP